MQQLQEKSCEQQKPLPPEGLWQSPKTNNVGQSCLLWLSRRLYVSDQYAPWQNGRLDEPLDPFSITGALKQDCVLALTLFSLYFATMINKIHHSSTGIDTDLMVDSTTLTDFIHTQRVPPSVCENFSVLTTMQLWAKLSLTFRDQQTCIIRTKKCLGCRSMSKYKDPPSNKQYQMSVSTLIDSR